jgi:hypothetical protein
MCLPDARSAASEVFAVRALGFDNPVIGEKDLMRQFPGLKVPEGIFNDPAAPKDSLCSVEVKRIIGGRLPSDHGGVRVLRRQHIHTSTCRVRSRGAPIVWPWTTSVEAALCKLHPIIMHRYKISTHHAVFLVPESAPVRMQRKIGRHILSITDLHVDTLEYKVRIHMFKCPDHLFDRLQ